MGVKKEVMAFLLLGFLLLIVNNVDGAANVTNDIILVANDGDSPYNCQNISDDIGNYSVINFTNGVCHVTMNISLSGTLNIIGEHWYLNNTNNLTPRIYDGAASAVLNITNSNLTSNHELWDPENASWGIQFATGAVFITDSMLAYYGAGTANGILLSNSNVTIENNTMRNATSGIVLTNGGGFTNAATMTLANNTIQDCLMVGSSLVPSGYGIYISQQFQNLTIQNNTISGCGVGIRIEDSSSLITITNNTIYNNIGFAAAGPAGLSGVGIYSNATNINITHNTFYGNNMSLRLWDAATSNFVYGNRFNASSYTTKHVETAASVTANLTSFGNWYSDAYATGLNDTGMDGLYDTLLNETDLNTITVATSAPIVLTGGEWNDYKAVTCETGWQPNTSCIYTFNASTSISTQEYNFSYLPGGNQNFTNCTLIINGVNNQTDAGIEEGILNNFTVTQLDTGSYELGISCVLADASTLTLESGNLYSSGNITLTVSNNVPTFGYVNVTAVDDVRIGSNVPNNAGDSDNGYLLVGNLSGALNQGDMHNLMNFSLPNISNVTISSAILNGFVASDGGPISFTSGNINVSAYLINNSWLPGTCTTGTGCTNNATWNGTTWSERWNGSQWDSLGGDYLSNKNTSVVNWTADSTNELVTFNVTDFFVGWYNGSYEKYGMLLKEIVYTNQLSGLRSSDASGRNPAVDLNFTVYNLTTYDNANITINITNYFTDADADSLNYSCSVSVSNTSCIDHNDSSISIISTTIGPMTLNITASDEFDTTHSNTITIDNNDTTNPTNPNLTSPANVTRTNNTLPVLNWTTVTETNFTNYTIQFSDNVSFPYVNHTYNVTGRNNSNLTLPNQINQVDAFEYLTWYWRVIAYDWTNNSNTSDPFTLRLDTKVPVLSGQDPTGSVSDLTPTISFTTTEEATCKGTIDTDESYGDLDFTFTGVGTTSHTYTAPTQSAGEHTMYVRCQDSYNNLMGSSNSWTFTVLTSTGGDGGGGGGGGGSGSGDDDDEEHETGDDTTKPTVVEEGESAEVGDVATTKYVQVALGGSVEFTFNEGLHTLEVTEITETTATIIISSDPVELTLTIGETKEVELEEGLLTVTLNSIVDGKADISFGALTEPVVEEEASFAWIGSLFSWIWGLIITIISFIINLIVIIFTNKWFWIIVLWVAIGFGWYKYRLSQTNKQATPKRIAPRKRRKRR